MNIESESAGGLFDLRGRTALVTGGSRGIGRMIAEGFVAHGARVYVVGSTLVVDGGFAYARATHGHPLP